MEQLIASSESNHTSTESCNFQSSTPDNVYLHEITESTYENHYDCYTDGNEFKDESSNEQSSNNIRDSIQVDLELHDAVQFMKNNEVSIYRQSEHSIVLDLANEEETRSNRTKTENIERSLCNSAKANCLKMEVDSDYENDKIAIKSESQSQSDATEDESMAAEALRQLGGMYEKKDYSTNKIFVCGLCDATFSSSKRLIDHASNCGNISNNAAIPHVCSVCGESFERKSALGNHLVCHQVDRPHSCRICGNLYRRKQDLHSHMICHQNERSHRCTICGADFQRPSSLTNHMKIHNYLPGRAMIAGNVPSTQNQTSVHVTEEQELVDQWAPFLTSADNSSSLFNQNLPSLHTLPSWNMNMPFGFTTDSQGISQIGQEINVNTSFPEDAHLLNQLSEFSNDTPDNAKILEFGKMRNEFLPVKLEKNHFATEVVDLFCTNSTKVSLNSGDLDKRPHTCRHCGVGFSRAKALISHERLHQDTWEGSVDCEQCCDSFSDEASLSIHALTCRDKIRMNTARTNQQQMHVKTHIHKASVKSSSDYGYRTEHRENNTTTRHGDFGVYEPQTKSPTKVNKQHVCPECSKKFATKQKMFRHMWIHRKKTFTCEVCSITFGQQNELDEHRLGQHPGDSPYLCQECGKCFASRQGLWEHGRVHGGGAAGLYHCNECDKQFASRQGYLIHTRTHTGERPYGCRYCWKAFRDGGTLRKHERIHTGERPHACPLCPRAFNQKVVLREHVRWVHAANKAENAEAPFNCQLCGKTSSDREELCAHIVKHSDQIAAIAKEAASKLAPTAVNETQHTTVINRSDPVIIKQNKKVLKKVKDRNSGRITNVKNNIRSKLTMRITQTKLDVPIYGDLMALNRSACDMCGDTFNTKELLRNHVKIHI